MGARRGKRAAILLSSSSSSEDDDDDDCDEIEDEEDECSDSNQACESDEGDGDGCDEIEDEEDDNSDSYQASESDASDDDDDTLADKVLALLREGNGIESLKLRECKTYLRKHGLRLAGNRADCFARIREHWRLKSGDAHTLYPRSSFTIDCTGDVCKGDVVLFRQKVYEKFSKVTRHGRLLGSRTIAGRVVKESYGAAKQQHTFTVEVMWSSGIRKLPPLFPLLVKGRNLYKQRTYRQRWNCEADRVKVLSEKHKRGAAARFTRTMKRKRKSCYANGSKGSKRQHGIQNTRRSKKQRSGELDKDRQFDGRSRAIRFQPLEAENTSSRVEHGWHQSPEFDHYQAPVYPLYARNPQTSYQFQVNSQRREPREYIHCDRGLGPHVTGSHREPSEHFHYDRGLMSNMTGFPPFRPRVRDIPSRSLYPLSSNSHLARSYQR